MKVLVVSYYSLWSSSVGGRRMAGLVRGLVERGDEVVVVAAEPANGLRAQPIDGARMLVTGHRDRVITARRLVDAVRKPRSAAPVGTVRGAPNGSPRTGRALNTARAVVSFPDTMWGWHRAARRAVLRDGFLPDVVVASAPPMAALVAAAELAERLNRPWVADMRDLWSGDPYRVIPRPLRRLDRRLEARTLRSAGAITTVAAPLADELAGIAPGIPVSLLRNGFDAAWVRQGDGPPAAPPVAVFTGTLTSNTGRDLSPLRDAARLLAERHGDGGPTIHIYGATDAAGIPGATDPDGTTELRFHGMVGADEVRRAQHAASVLLSFSWDDPREFHKTPAKLFEYAAARRPVVHVGRVDSLGVRLIREHHLGDVVPPDHPDAIADAIERHCDGSSGWRPPSVAEIAPLSQAAMVKGFFAAIDAAMARAQPAAG